MRARWQSGRSIGLSLRADPEGGAVALAMRRLMVAYPAIRRGGLVQLAVPLLTLLRGRGGEAGVAAGLRMLVFHSRIDDATALIAGRPSEDTNRFELALAQASLAIRRCELGAAEVALDQARELAASEDAGRQVLLGDSMVRALRGNLIRIPGGHRHRRRVVVERPRGGAAAGARQGAARDASPCAGARSCGRRRRGERRPVRRRGRTTSSDLIAILAHAELGELGPLDVLAGRLASRWRRTPRAPVQALLLGVIDRASGAEDASLQLLDEARVQAERGRRRADGGAGGLPAGAGIPGSGRVPPGRGPAAPGLGPPRRWRGGPPGGPGHRHRGEGVRRRRPTRPCGGGAGRKPATMPPSRWGACGRWPRPLAATSWAARVLLPPALEGAGPQALGERSCDEALVEMMGGDPHRAQLAAEAAIAAIGDAALPHLRARSHLLLAAAAQARGDAATADAEASAAESMARARGYQPILRFLDLLRATRSAGRAVLDRTTLGLRGGLSGVLRVLGLDPSTLVVDTPSGRLHLGADGVAQI